ncbi:MAG: hypothetical protein ACHQRM_04570 [Bacteroidia bacterium]
MNPNKLFRFSELMWMVIFIACILTDLFILIIQRDMSKALFFCGLCAMSGIMYFVRRRMRIRAEKVMGVESDPQKSKKKR